MENKEIKRFVLPAGTIIKIEGIPFELERKTIVRGANVPEIDADSIEVLE